MSSNDCQEYLIVCWELSHVIFTMLKMEELLAKLSKFAKWQLFSLKTVLGVVLWICSDLQAIHSFSAWKITWLHWQIPFIFKGYKQTINQKIDIIDSNEKIKESKATRKQEEGFSVNIIVSECSKYNQPYFKCEANTIIQILNIKLFLVCRFFPYLGNIAIKISLYFL